MSRQDKAVTERHTKALREMLKKQDNKLCADCKRNDPRWASWNIGVFLCIRCSGIHRSMGTHISKVKSVDLDTWTPPQMEVISKWGNRLANKYWEAHLKEGHVPPEQKMDSFIRSKYETRRWALDGPIPNDPRVLDTDAAISSPQPPQPIAAPPPLKQTPSTNFSAPRHQLLSTTHRQQQQQQPVPQLQSPEQKPQPTTAAVESVPTPQNDLFSLDFHSSSAPASAAVPQSANPSRNAKQDIMSLFASSPSPSSQQVQTPWSQPQQSITQQQPKQQTMMGANGVGMWGVSSGWAPPPQQQSQNIWGDFMSSPNEGMSMGFSQQQQQQQQPQMQSQYGGQPQMQVSAGIHQQIPHGGPQPLQLFETNDIWASSTSAATGTNMIGNGGGAQKDAFDDIWGGFK